MKNTFGQSVAVTLFGESHGEMIGAVLDGFAPGLQVDEDFMREECDKLNPVFFHYIITKTPYVVMKYAMTADGKIATRTGASKWITGEKSREEVQYMRHQYRGIMVGIGTVLADDPMLNVRLSNKRSPVRIICDSRLRIPLDSQICQTAKEYSTIVACAEDPCRKKEALEGLGIEVVCCPNGQGRVDLVQLMNHLGKQGIDSILLEGGGTLNDSALQQGIVQRVMVFLAPKLFGGEMAQTPVAGSGVELPAESALLQLGDIRQLEGDLLLEYEVIKQMK